MEGVHYLPTANPERKTVEYGGYIVDADTGDVLGFAEAPQGKKDFAVVDVESAEWVQRKMLEADSEIKAIDENAEVQLARAVMANAEVLKKPHQSKLEWLDKTFGSAIEEVASQNLPRGKRTWQSLFGSVAFRAVKPILSITSPERAAKWLAKKHPECVRITADLDALSPDDRTYIASLAEEGTDGIETKIMKDKIPASVLALAKEKPDFEVESGLAYVAGRDSATHTIGAKPTKGKRAQEGEE